MQLTHIHADKHPQFPELFTFRFSVDMRNHCNTALHTRQCIRWCMCIVHVYKYTSYAQSCACVCASVTVCHFTCIKYRSWFLWKDIKCILFHDKAVSATFEQNSQRLALLRVAYACCSQSEGTGLNPMVRKLFSGFSNCSESLSYSKLVNS